MGAKGFAVDLNEPLVFQVCHLGDAYEEWVHQPIISNKGPQFFQSNIHEAHCEVGNTYSLAASGGILHIDVCEGRPFGANTAHYLLHGCHHKHTMDGLRLVFPPAATSILCIPAYNLSRLISTPSTTPALFGGVLLGYVMYDCTHYYLHH